MMWHPQRFLSACVSISVSLALLGSTGAQVPDKNPDKNIDKNNDRRSGAQSVQLELVRIETGFFEAWKAKDDAYFREHMPENGIFWGENGALARDQQIAAQQASAKTCTVEGYSLSDFGALPLATGAYLLTYKFDQYGTCNGERLPVHMNGSSIYVLKTGHWQAIYRAEVPLKGQG